MNYSDGSQIRIGDVIWWNEGMALGRVAEIVEKKADQLRWGLQEPGIFIDPDTSRNAPRPAVFNAEAQLEDEGIAKLSQADAHRLLALESRIHELLNLNSEQRYAIWRRPNERQHHDWLVSIVAPTGEASDPILIAREPEDFSIGGI